MLYAILKYCLEKKKNYRNEFSSGSVFVGCVGMNWKNCVGELNLKFSKLCDGWGMIQ